MPVQRYVRVVHPQTVLAKEPRAVDFRTIRETRDRIPDIKAGLAKATRRSYASGWKAFCSWCGMAGRPYLPADSATVEDFAA